MMPTASATSWMVRGGVEIIVDVFDNGIHPRAGGVAFGGVAIDLRVKEKEEVKEQLGDEKLVGRIVLGFALVEFLQQIKKEILELIGVICIGSKDQRLVDHETLDGFGREVFLQEAVLEVHQKACSAGAAGAVKQIDGNPDQIPCLDVEKAILDKVFALAVENEIDLVGVVIVHDALRRFESGFFDIKLLGCGINGGHWRNLRGFF